MHPPRTSPYAAARRRPARSLWSRHPYSCSCQRRRRQMRVTDIRWWWWRRRRRRQPTDTRRRRRRRRLVQQTDTRRRRRRPTDTRRQRQRRYTFLTQGGGSGGGGGDGKKHSSGTYGSGGGGSDDNQQTHSGEGGGGGYIIDVTDTRWRRLRQKAAAKLGQRPIFLAKVDSNPSHLLSWALRVRRAAPPHDGQQPATLANLKLDPKTSCPASRRTATCRSC